MSKQHFSALGIVWVEEGKASYSRDGTGAILSSDWLTTYEMMDKVNEKLPKEEQFGALWWYASKYQRLHREYRRMYPEGGLLLKVRVLWALMFACMFVCVWEFGFFAK
jgi:hypothetical protein